MDVFVQGFFVRMINTSFSVSDTRFLNRWHSRLLDVDWKPGSSREGKSTPTGML